MNTNQPVIKNAFRNKIFHIYSRLFVVFIIFFLTFEHSAYSQTGTQVTLKINNPDFVCGPQTVDLTTAAITAGSDPGLVFSYWLNEDNTIPVGTPSAVPAGTYYITGKRTVPTFGIASLPVIITADPIPSVTLVQPTCLVATGTITVNSPKGTGMTYSIDGSNYSNITGIFNFVIAGNYKVTAKTLAGCISAINNVTIIPAIPVAPTASIIQPTCTVPTGTITVTAPTEAGMTYSIDGSNYSNSTGIFTLLIAGNYDVTAKNSLGCISPGTRVTINAQPVTPPAPTTSTIQPTCVVATGTITVTAPVETGMTYSIDGMTYTNTTGIFTTLSPGTFNVTAKSSVGCISPIKSVIIDVQPPTPPAPTASAIQPTCAVASGTITVTAPKEAGMTYSIDGLNYSNVTGVFTLVRTGTYNVTAKSLAGCISAGTSITILTTIPPAPTVTATLQPSCSVSTGTITITAPTEAGMTYSIDGVNYINTTGIFTLVNSGNYDVTAKNAVGCISESTKLTINTQPTTPLAPTVTITQPTCSVATGAITVTAPTGAGITYSIDGSTYTNTTGIFSAVLPGNYDVTAKNLAGCLSPITKVTINVQPVTPPAPTATATLQPTCSVATGTITVTAPTAVGMTYSIDGVTYTNTTGIFTIVSAGVYNVTAKNLVGCISPITSVTINPQPATPPAPTASVIQPTCTVATGTITITAPMAVGMTYSIDGLTYTNTTGIFTLVNTDTYSLTAKSSAGCISASTSVTILAATPSTPTLSTIQPTCLVSTGTITITAPKETGMTYSIDGLTYTNTTGIFNVVNAGNYVVTAKSLAGCISPTTNVTIDPQPVTPPAPTASAATQPTCAVSTGSINVSAPKGAGLTYSIDGFNYANTTGLFTLVNTGIYSVTVKSAAGCISANSVVTIDSQPVTPPSPTATVTTQPTCDVATGTITVTAPTGVGMTYSIDGSDYANTTGLFTSVGAGNINVTAKNAAGCISPVTSLTILAVKPAPPTVTIIHPTCLVATGSITVTAPIAAGMTYSIDDVTYTNLTGIFTSVSPGNYKITAKSASGCISESTSLTIDAQPTTPPAPTASTTLQPTCSVATGTISITAPIGVGMTYSINGSDYTNTSGIFTSLIAGNYNVTAKNLDGCVSASSVVTINAQPATPPAPTAGVTLQPTCTTASGTITVTAPTGIGMTYSIDGSTYTNTTGIFTSVAVGNYNVSVKSSAGCISSGTSVIIQSAIPTAPTASVTLQPTCTVATGTITVTAPTGTGMTYSIDGSTYINTTGVFNSVAGNYFVTAKNIAGCISASTSVTIDPQPVTPSAPIAIITQPTCEIYTGTITVSEPLATGMTYSIDGLTYTNTTGIFIPLDPGTYSVTAKSAMGCISASASMVVNSIPDVFVPNVFTPNADGIHDLFEINCLDPTNYPNAQMQIFNRNGNLVYKNDHYGNPDLWNGRSVNKLNVVNDELPVGTYYYVLKLGDGKVLSGYLFLAK